MTASQQHLLDAYRAAQHGAPVPPAPGRHDWQTVRELRDTVREDLRFRAVVAERPAGAYLRAALTRIADRFRTVRTRPADGVRTARTTPADGVRTARTGPADGARTLRTGSAAPTAPSARARTADCN
ncbi:hypothetical protein [Streptomyces cremeus]|uniref:Uncharacterized protein n=1 Tax=Streptomyces cremeus TaxID=66881 RepID=A0ABV5PHI9_STRCM